MVLNRKIVFGFAFVAMVSLVVITGSPAPVQAHKGAKGVVLERMNQMKEMKDRLKSISDMLEGKKAYSDKQVRQSLDYIRAHAGKAMTKLFPKGTGHKPSEADPVIWKDWAAFEKQAMALNHSTDRFRAKLSGTPDAAALKSLQKDHLAIRRVCKACHEKFRL